MSRPVLCLVVFGIKVTGSRGEVGVSKKGALYDSFSHIFNDFSLCHPCQLTCDLLHCDYDSDLISHIMANCLIVGSKTIYYKAVSLWNQLDDSFKLIQLVANFKCKLRSHRAVHAIIFCLCARAAVVVWIAPVIYAKPTSKDCE